MRKAGCTAATSEPSSEDGFLVIVDRLKELIKVKGFQVAPAELESLLLKHHRDRRLRGDSRAG